jgi:hypothetical protein
MPPVSQFNARGHFGLQGAGDFGGTGQPKGAIWGFRF